MYTWFRLAQVDLLDAADKNSGAYSGGMKRRLCVAMVLNFVISSLLTLTILLLRVYTASRL